MIKQRCNDHWLLIGLNYLIKTAFEELEMISVYIPSLWCVMGTLTFSLHATNTNWVLSLATIKNKSSSLTFASLSGKNLLVDSPLWQRVKQAKMSSHVVSLLTLAAKYLPKKGEIYLFMHLSHLQLPGRWNLSMLASREAVTRPVSHFHNTDYSLAMDQNESVIKDQLAPHS